MSKNGKTIECCYCAGSGQIWNPAEGWSDECSHCGGSGQHWQYNNGAIARYYGGPLIGKEPSPKVKETAE